MLAEKPIVRIFIEPQDGFESYISAAIAKKGVAVVVTQDRDAAKYIITSTVTQKEESTGGKIARCAFAYCAGINGSQTVSIQLIDPKTKDVAFAYNVRKGGSANFQSSAEAIAKHLKQFLEQK
jgi:hypothetical protein